MLLEVNTKGLNRFLNKGRGLKEVWSEGNDTSAPS
jgi:hypothetical protein